MLSEASADQYCVILTIAFIVCVSSFSSHMPSYSVTLATSQTQHNIKPVQVVSEDTRKLQCKKEQLQFN